MNSMRSLLDLYTNDPDRWCPSYAAYDGAGRIVKAISTDACKWSLRGAAERVGGDQAPALIEELRRRIKQWYARSSVPNYGNPRFCVALWEDHPSRTFEDVLKLLSQDDVAE